MHETMITSAHRRNRGMESQNEIFNDPGARCAGLRRFADRSQGENASTIEAEHRPALSDLLAALPAGVPSRRQHEKIVANICTQGRIASPRGAVL